MEKPRTVYVSGIEPWDIPRRIALGLEMAMGADTRPFELRLSVSAIQQLRRYSDHPRLAQDETYRSLPIVTEWPPRSVAVPYDIAPLITKSATSSTTPPTVCVAAKDDRDRWVYFDC